MQFSFLSQNSIKKGAVNLITPLQPYPLHRERTEFV